MDNKSSNKGEKKALIIAISDYDNLPQEKQLPFCRNDGVKIYEILQEQGYKIREDWKLIGRVSSDRLKKAIFDFFRKQSQPKDTLLFYFSGHGIPDGHGGHYFASSDIETELPDYYGFKFTELEDQANKSLATKIVTILDCCFSGAVGAKDDEEGLAKSARSDMDRTFKEGDGKCVLASSLAGQVSYKKKGEPYSLFTYYLLEGLKGGNGEAVNLQGYVTPYTLGIYIYNRITTEDRRQRPITKTATSGEIILAHYPELVKRQEEASRRSELDIEQIRAELEKNPQNQVDVLRKMLSKINRDEVLSTTRTKDFIMFKLGELTHGEIGYNPNGVSVEPLD